MQRKRPVISARFGAPEPKESDAGQRSFASAGKRPFAAGPEEVKQSLIELRYTLEFNLQSKYAW